MTTETSTVDITVVCVLADREYEVTLDFQTKEGFTFIEFFTDTEFYGTLVEVDPTSSEEAFWVFDQPFYAAGMDNPKICDKSQTYSIKNGLTRLLVEYELFNEADLLSMKLVKTTTVSLTTKEEQTL